MKSFYSSPCLQSIIVAALLLIVSVSRAASEHKDQLVYSATKYEHERLMVRKKEGIDAVESALRERLKEHGLSKIPVLIALADLDGDGVNEIFVYLSAPGYCGSAGCSLTIYKQLARGKLQQLLWTSSATGRVSVFDTSTNGYKDIYIEGVRAGTLSWVDRRWVWTGKTYIPFVESRHRHPAVTK